MSSLIEQAAQRLAQIRQAGIEVPGDDAGAAPVAPPQAPAAPVAAAALPVHAPAVPTGPAMAPASPAAAPASVPVGEPVVTSRRVELDLDALLAAGVVTPNAPRSNVADQYRVIKRPLIQNAVGKGAVPLNHGNLIMVTSALSGEGKSFTSVNLAMSIAAELDHTVMLVDADVARPSVLRMLGLPPGPGLLDLLEGRAEMSNVLLRTNIDKLTLLPSGTPHPRATELLASDSMRQLLDDMATRYPDRIIIFDSPPLLLTTESRVLASQMGQIVVVVHAGKTLQADVQHALSTIESCPVRMMLLNKARTISHGAYGYGYGYGYGYEEDDKPKGEAS
ncbi:MAG: tyrosine-protein kinase family protein [Burkholderiales bacterium]|nr:tyrosine-protein kinase family protein [Burkholderiales bacterium]